MKKLFLTIFLIWVPVLSLADINVTLDGGISGITSNSVIDIDHDSTSVWLGTGSGPAVSEDGGSTWTTFGKNPLPSDEVSALAANNRGVWVATSHSQVAQGSSYPFGDGISLTRNDGQTWTTFTPEQSAYYGKISYDLALYDSVAYSACFYGGLIRTTDFGTSWKMLIPTQLDSINTDSIDYVTRSYSSFSNRMFAVKTDTTAFPDTFSVWAGSAKGIYRFIYTTDFSDDFSNGLRKWKIFGAPVPTVIDTLVINVDTTFGVFSNNGDSLCNSGIVSKKLFGAPDGFQLETDVYLEITDTLGCFAEGGIGLTKTANPNWYGDCSDSSFNGYGLYFSLKYVGDACSDSAIPPEARRHAWFVGRILKTDGTIDSILPYSINGDAWINGWHTMKVIAERTECRLYIDNTLLWTTAPLGDSIMSGRNIVLGFRSWSDSLSAGRAYHNAVRGFQTGTRTYPTYPDSIAHYYFIYGDTTLPDSLKLPGNHIVSLGINKVGNQKTVWAACRPVSSGELMRVAFSRDDGRTWHAVGITDETGDPNVEGWDFAFNDSTVFVATSYGLYSSDGNYENDPSWKAMSAENLIDPQHQTFYQKNAPFYSVDFANGVLWAGGNDGAVRSLNGGWRVIRSGLQPNETYAYPSPFSPTLSTRKGTTIHFKPSSDTKATVRIYDFNLELVKTVAENIQRAGGVESDDIVWDGKNGKGNYVANGVYFYRIELDSGDDIWGKVVVIK